jgi:hypothetical protein
MLAESYFLCLVGSIQNVVQKELKHMTPAFRRYRLSNVYIEYILK